MSVRSTLTTTTTNQGPTGAMQSPSTTELCINLVSEFAQGNITRNEATQESTEAFRELSAHDEVTPEQVQSAITSFVAVLDQAQSTQVNAARQG